MPITPVKRLLYFAGDLRHQSDRCCRQRRFDIGQIVAVLQDHGVHPRGRIMSQVRQRLFDDLAIVTAVHWRAWQRRHRDHRRQKFIGNRAHQSR